MRSGTLGEARALPTCVEPGSAGDAQLDALLAWVCAERSGIEDSLRRVGGLLLRGFALSGAAEFERLCRSFAPELAGYAGGDSQRSAVHGRVYTSTEYPAPLEIPLHNELSYAARWPSRIFFFCEEPATAGGETPIADSRELLREIPRPVVERFRERGVLYVRNLHGGWGLGRSWQQTFETDRRDLVEQHCRDAGIEFAWEGDRLRLRERRPALIRHPETDEELWFNQADLWHVSRLGPRREAALRKTLGDDDLPQHACHADGSPIDTADLDAIRAAGRRVEVAFRWQRGDALVLDNRLVAHGRRPFEGPRRILAAMA